MSSSSDASAAAKSSNECDTTNSHETNKPKFTINGNDATDNASHGGCPFFESKAKPKFPEWQTSTSIDSESLTYTDYLQLDKILNAQSLISKKYGSVIHDEHLFIVIHQAYELWFKHIIYEIDSIKKIFNAKFVDDRCLLVIVQRIQRINLIWKLLTDQITILETMAPTDFLDFRGYLSTASGFQSLQFRLVENKLGLAESHRIKFNQQKYDYTFTDPESRRLLDESVSQPSLLKLIEAWLERTPGLMIYVEGVDGNKKQINHFKNEYEKAVQKYLNDSYLYPAEIEKDETTKQALLEEHRKTYEAFQTIFDVDKHNKLLERGERKLSHLGLWGAIMIWLNRDEPRFHLPYQLLLLLIDLDTLINRWRYNHALLVQREVGNKSGTGGSSGYSYLRSTATDRYKVFYDIVNLSTWLIPRQYVPKLTEDMKRQLSQYSMN